MKRPDIIRQIAETMHRVAPSATTMVYGSEARGDARPDSDIDLLILLDVPVLTVEQELLLRQPLSALEAQTGIAINALTMRRQDWEARITPFRLTVNREGVVL